ncbi:hypothetical protein B0H17DRAFT_1072241 [Mycena rosella]|uniref:Uncharacterized protein n=1 Tax=Mycena rosella TaxID=1033263 RepID=A0AAD7DB06_MYCRO|nr:hypothetical protein B0H17DRAFT_1072241 [Mycena rosella]
MADDYSPTTLPLDLERHIFELSAVSRPVSIPNLLRVAWRVKHWVEPLLYRTLIICKEPENYRKVDELPWCTLEDFNQIVRRTESASFLRDSVRNVMFQHLNAGEIDSILSACSGLHNMHALGCEDPTAFPDSLRLRRLHCDNDDHPALKLSSRHITHLELFIGLTLDYDLYEDDPTQWSAVTRLPHLTHLSLNFKSLLPVCLHLLDACNSLCALIILRSSPAYPVPETLAGDPRFVMMELPQRTADWQRGILTGDDYWARADAFIAKRRSGEIDRRTFFLEADRS